MQDSSIPVQLGHWSPSSGISKIYSAANETHFPSFLGANAPGQADMSWRHTLSLTAKLAGQTVRLIVLVVVHGCQMQALRLSPANTEHDQPLELWNLWKHLSVPSSLRP